MIANCTERFVAHPGIHQHGALKNSFARFRAQITQVLVARGFAPVYFAMDDTEFTMWGPIVLPPEWMGEFEADAVRLPLNPFSGPVTAVPSAAEEDQSDVSPQDSQVSNQDVPDSPSLTPSPRSKRPRVRRRIRKKSSSYWGVTWNAYSGQWKAYARERHIGYFRNEEDAARAHDTVVVEKWEAEGALPGSLRLNFPDEFPTLLSDPAVRVLLPKRRRETLEESTDSDAAPPNTPSVAEEEEEEEVTSPSPKRQNTAATREEDDLMSRVRILEQQVQFLLDRIPSAHQQMRQQDADPHRAEEEKEEEGTKK